MNLEIRMKMVPDFASVVSALGYGLRDFDWHLADIDSNPYRPDLAGGWMSGEALDAELAREVVQFKWGVIDAVPKGFRCVLDNEPWADGNGDLWKDGAAAQMPFALFEVVYWDSSSVMLFGMTSQQAGAVVDAFGATALSVRTF
jgi:hypothetical protein